MADIDSLSIQISADASSAVNGLKTLSDTLGRLKDATKGGLGLSSIANQVGKLAESSNNINGTTISNLKGLADGMKKLSEIGNLKISSSIANQITKINTALSGLNIGDGANKISEVVSALKPLETLGKSSLGTTVNALNKLPEALKKLDTKQLYTQIQSLTRIFKPLADEMQKVANGFNAFPSRIQKLITENEKLDNSNNKVGTSYVNLWAKFRMAYNTIKTVAKTIAGFIKKSNEYIENMNLFNASMGKYAEEARTYAEQVGEVMGIDPGEWMRNQGMFMTLATGFGVVSDRAYTMSKNLTQLGYDLSSFFNISYEDAMLKLQSGLAGELEPLRRIGYDLSQARLQQEAYTLGITKKVSAMTQAEKAELRYHAIMTQVTTAQGDMARTLNAPANQLRVLSAQVAQAGRALGNIFIPALNAVLPVAIAVVKVIRLVAESIASLFGFELPEVDYSGLDGMVSGANDVGNALDGATDSAKKLQQYTMGFDELNVIDPNQGSSGNNSGNDGASNGTGFDFELPEYDFLDGAIGTKVDEIMKKIKPALETIKEHMDTILEVVGSIGAGAVAWNLTGIAKSLVQAIKNKEIDKVKLGISFLVTGITLGLVNGYEIGKEGLTWENLITQALATALMIGGSLLTFGTGPLGWTIGIATALVINVVSIALGKRAADLENDLDKRFGEYELSDTEIDAWVQSLTTNDLSIQLDLYVSEQDAVAKAKIQVENAITELNGYNFRIACGLEVSQTEYESAIDDYITSAKGYLEQKQVTAMLAIDISLGDSETGNRLSTFASAFYNANNLRLSELGNELRKVVSDGFVNGEWIPDKRQEAIDLQKEMQEILDYISEVEFDAKMTALKLDANDTDITSESFKALLDKANTEIENQMKNLEAVRLESLKIAKMEFDQNILNGMSKESATEIYNQTVAQIESEFQQGKVNLTYGTFDFGIEVIKSKYSDEMSQTVPFLQQTTQELFTQGSMVLLPEDTYNNIDDLMMQLTDAYIFGFEGMDISDAARENIGTLLEQLKPSEEQFNGLVADAMKTGSAVPENVRKGLSDINQLKAITGDVEAMNYLIGEKLSTDSSFLDLLATSEGAGASINDEVSKGLYSNLTIVEDAANGTITLMNDTIGEKVLDVTPTLVENLKDLGYNLSDGLLKGADKKISADKKKWYEWAWLPWNWFKEKNEINSPSKLFEDGGEYIADGLFNGVDKNTKQTDYDGVFGRLSNWFNNLLGITGQTSSVFDELGGFVSKGLFGGVDKNTKQSDYDGVWGKLKTWANNLFGTTEGNSTVFDTIGGKVSKGLFGGVDKNTKHDDYNSVFGRLSIWADSLFGNIGEGNSTVFATIGSKLGKGLFGGLSENTKHDDYDSVFGRLSIWADSLFGNIGEGNSTVFATIGSKLAKGLYGGVNGGVTQTDYETIFGRINKALDNIKTPIKTTINSIIGLVESLANKLVEGINAMIGKLNSVNFTVPSWIPGLGGKNFGLNIPTVKTISIPRLATGGMVDTGEMFIAREAGPELVGNIRRKTAVVNNEQIVASVARGVADANSEQNSLLKEQNSLLRALLEKESGVYLDGKRLTNSVEKYQSQRGRRIVVGGAL